MNYLTISRRKFIQLAGATTTGLLICPATGATNAGKPVLRFGILSDVHYADREPADGRFYPQSELKLKEGIDQMNRDKVDFIIELGDFKDQDAVPTEAQTLKYLETIEHIFQQFDGPTYHVLGNHDMDSISKQQFLNHVVNTGISDSESYYSFDQKGFHFIVLDGNFTQEGTAYDHGNFSWDDAYIPDSQINWLKLDLKATQGPAIVFIHQMLDDSKNKKQSISNAAQVRQVLEQSGKVLCVFQGHVHEERYSQINQIHYYSLFAMVDNDGPENNSYMRVDIFKDGSLEVKGYRRATDRQFSSNQ